MNKQIRITLNEKQHKKIFDAAASKGQKIQEYVLDAIEQYNAREQLSIYSPTIRIPEYDFTFIDLFAGIGGMRLAFEEAGGKCLFSSEWEKNCKVTYFENFGDTPSGDITKIKEKEVPSHDILAAGFPCQPFSIAGVSKKKSLGRAHGFLDKTQGTLFFDVARIIKAKRPKAFILENVKNLKSHFFN